MSGPPLDELLDDLAPDERERLARAHARLIAAGPPPELPPTLVEPPAPPAATVHSFPQRYRFTAIAAAVAVAAAVFVAGYLVGGARAPDAPVRTLAMSGPGGATADLSVFDVDDAGNWPMKLEVSGLPALPAGGLYELWLTRGGKLAESCGTFVTNGAGSTVRLNAPYRLRAFTGWVVTRHGDDAVVLRTESV